MPVHRIATALLSALFCLCASLQADTVILKSGEKLEGKILSETDAEITMSVQVTATIRDERVVKRDEIDKVQKVQPEEEAWVALGNLVPGGESLDWDDYDRIKAALQYFITSFPQSAYAAVAKERLDQFSAEQARVSKGEVKLNNQWLAKEKVKEERIQVGGRILLNRMKRAASAAQVTEAMSIFDQLEKGFIGSASYPEAVELARRLLPAVKVAVEERQAQFKRRIEDEKQRLKTSKGAEHDQLAALIKKQSAATEAIIAATEKAGIKWLPLYPANDRSLTAMATRVKAETTRLDNLNTDKMQESVAASATAEMALSVGKLDEAEKSLRDATTAWPANELAKRLQVKLADAKKGAAATKVTIPPPTPTPKPKKSSSASSTPVAPAPVQSDEPQEKSFFKSATFFIGLAVIIAFGAVAGKMIAKSRASPTDVLDK